MTINESISENNPILKAALGYAAKGLPVVACYGIVAGSCTCGGRSGCRKGKHPIPAHGANDATTDASVIRKWWADHPWANVGIVMGERSGVFVVETDPRNGGDATMSGWVAEHGGPPTTPTVRSGGGGEHRYFRLPEGASVKSRAIGKGVDAKGSGLVIAPPSMHASGNRYEWTTTLDTPLADAPGWLRAMTETAEAATASPSRAVPAPDDGFVMGSSEPSDFATHPGAERGTQNDTMMRLLGVHIDRGDSLATIEALASSWALRCSPPIPTNEVQARLRWAEGKREARGVDSGGGLGEDDGENESAIGRNGRMVVIPPANAPDEPSYDHYDHAPNAASGMGDPIPQPLSPSDDWPTLHPDALHGLAGAFVRAIEPETEADPAGVLLSLLTAFGNVVGKAPRFAMNAGRHHANIFAAIVGDTASGKGQSWGVVQRVMAEADPGWEGEAIGYGLSSGEGLVDRIKDEADADAVPPEKRLLCVETEFARPITAMRREGNTLSPLLRAAWDSQTLEVLTRGKSKLRASNAHVSILAHVTPEELAKLLSNSVEVANGFANRFLWALARRSKSLPDGGDSRVIEPFVGPLREAIERARVVGPIQRGNDAKALWHGVYDGLTEARPGAFGMATSRGHAQTLRLSLLYALLDGSDTIRAEHLRAALAVWAYCEASARIIFGGSSVVGGGPEPLSIRLLNAIMATPGVNRRELRRAFRSTTEGDFNGALAALESKGLAHRGRCQPEGGGRPAECWWPGPGDDPDGDDDDGFTMGSSDDSAPPPATRAEAAGVLASRIDAFDHADDGRGRNGRKVGTPPANAPDEPSYDHYDHYDHAVVLTVGTPTPSYDHYDHTTIATNADAEGIGGPVSLVPTPHHLSPPSNGDSAEADKGMRGTHTLSPGGVGAKGSPDTDTLAESRAIEADDFIAEITAKDARDPNILAELNATEDAVAGPIGDGDEMSVELYYEALAAAGIDPKTPPPYDKAQARAIKWAKGYALAQAALAKRRREMEAEPEMTAVEFRAELMAMA